MPYPSLGFGEDYIDTPQTTKRGFIVPVTKEAVFFDRTHLILQRAAEVGEVLGLNKEKRLLDLLIGATNNYTWKGTRLQHLQRRGHGRRPGRQLGQPDRPTELVDWTDVDAAEQLFADILDPNTGEPVLIQADHGAGDAGLSPRRASDLQRDGDRLHQRTTTDHDGRQSAGQLHGGREPAGLSPADRGRHRPRPPPRSGGSSATSARPSPTWRTGRSP